MTISQVKEKCQDEYIEVTGHALFRIQQRGILYQDIKNAINTGEIIEDYPDDYPYPSCLILGYTKEEKGLHVVVGLGENKLWIITAYYPDLNEWQADLRKRI